jgi:hypothetical protein
MKPLTIVPHPDPGVTRMKRIMLGGLFVFNALVSIHLAITEDFAHYLLNLLIFNVVLALGSYITWKVKFRQFTSVLNHDWAQVNVK